jgi:hypothetical protein
MKRTILSLLIIATTAFTGCDDKKIYKAKVVDSTVEGIEYQCGGIINYTNKDGQISCYHLPLGFRVGAIKIGVTYSLPADGILFPQDMLNVPREDLVNEKVKKLTMLLQTLDSDSNPANGITITKETRDKLDEFIDLQKVSLSELQEYLETKLNKTLINEDSAIEHLYRSMIRYHALPEDFLLEDETLE